MFRTRIIGAIIVFILFVSTMDLYFMDQIIQNLIIKDIQPMVGAKIDMKDASFSFFPPRFEIEGIQIASKENSTRNIIEWETMHGTLDMKELLRKNIIIDQFVIRDIKLDTPRKTSGKLERKDIGVLTRFMIWIDSFNQEKKKDEKGDGNRGVYREQKKEITVEEMIKSPEIKINSAVMEAQKEIESYIEKLSKELNLEKNKKEIDRFSNEVTEFVNSFDGRDLSEISEIWDEYKEIENKGKQIVNNIAKKQERVNTIYQKQKKIINSLGQAAETDKKLILNSLSLSKGASENLSNSIINTNIKRIIEGFIQNIKNTKKTVEDSTKIFNDQIDRKGIFEGKKIPFKVMNPHPKFWIKKLVFSNQNEGISGTITDISSDPVLIQKNIEVKVRLKEADIKGKIDLIKDRQYWTYKMEGEKLTPFVLLEENEKELKVRSGKNTIKANLNITQQNLKGSISIITHDLQAIKSPISKKITLMSITQRVLIEPIDVTTTVSVEGSLADIQLKIVSNLDKKIARAMKNIANNEIRKLKKEISRQVNEKLKLHESTLLAIDDNLNFSGDLLDQEKRMGIVNEFLDKEKKKLEKQIKNDAQNFLKEEAEKLLDKWF